MTRWCLAGQTLDLLIHKPQLDNLANLAPLDRVTYCIKRCDPDILPIAVEPCPIGHIELRPNEFGANHRVNHVEESASKQGPPCFLQNQQFCFTLPQPDGMEVTSFDFDELSVWGRTRKLIKIKQTRGRVHRVILRELRPPIIHRDLVEAIRKVNASARHSLAASPAPNYPERSAL